MSNPFDGSQGRFFVVVDGEGQHSLWPEFTDVPAGWTVVHRAADWVSCLRYVETNWTDIRLLSLVARLDRTAPAGRVLGP